LLGCGSSPAQETEPGPDSGAVWPDAGGDSSTPRPDASSRDSAAADQSVPIDSATDSLTADDATGQDATGDAATGGDAPIDAGQPSPSAFQVDGVATWRGNATAAYSLIHDDVCWPSVAGVVSVGEPELVSRGLHAGFGVIVGECDMPPSAWSGGTAPNPGGTWAQVTTLVDHGHDVFSHSANHHCLTNDSNLAQSCDPASPQSVDFATELVQAGDTLKMHTGLSNDFFIFPYDVCDPAAIMALQSAGYLGARCGQTAINMATVPDGFSVDYDVFGPSYSYYFGQGSCAKTAAGKKPVQYTTLPADYTDACRLFILNGYVDNVITAGGWGVREVHGFDPVDVPNGGWECVTLPDYQAHLDYLVTKINAGALWVEGPTRVLRYSLARDACAPPTIVTGSTLHFGAAPAACQKVTTTLTYRVSTTDGSDPPLVAVEQGGALLPVRRVSAGHFVVDADPSKGDAVLVQ
jgi:hypothetical protein